MATDVPQRQLRNDTASLLRRVQRGETLRVTVHGHPVAELRPLAAAVRYVDRTELEAMGGLMAADDPLDHELREDDDPSLDPFSP